MNPGWMAALAAALGLPLAMAGTPAAMATDGTPTYRPVFGAPASDPAPLGWREANDTVGRFTRGHMDLLREEPSPPDAPPASADALAPLTLEQAVTTALASDPRHYVLAGMSAADATAARGLAARRAHSVRAAWYTAVAARATLLEQEKQWQAADTGAELGQRMRGVGHWTAAQWAQERQQRHVAGVSLVQARTEVQIAVERLRAAIGVGGAVVRRPLALPDELPAPPLQASALDGLEALALQRHPGWQRQRVDTERRLAAIPADQLEQGRQALQAAVDTLALDVRALPVRQPALEHALEATAQTERLEQQLRAQVRTAWLRLRAAHEIATVTDAEAQALAAQRLADMQQRYNGMLASTWELLAASQAASASRAAATQARLAYWLADNDLIAAVAGANEGDAP